ncbi:MAG: hypothetical protein ABIO60_02610, partial [Aquaticitalea sp.]
MYQEPMETELNTEIKSFTYSFESSKSAKDIFNLLLVIDKWWSGVHEETISGKSRDLNDEFTFHAGAGAHYSKHRLVELVPNELIVWQVIESKLTFVNKTDEWDNTKL